MASFWEMSQGSTVRPETRGQTEGQYTEKPKSRESLVMMQYFSKSRLCLCQVFGRFLFPDLCCTHWHFLDQIFWRERSGRFHRVAVEPMVTLSAEKPSEPLKSSNSPTVLSRIVGVLKLLTCQRRCKTVQEEKERVSSSKAVKTFTFLVSDFVSTPSKAFNAIRWKGKR